MSKYIKRIKQNFAWAPYFSFLTACILSAFCLSLLFVKNIQINQANKKKQEISQIANNLIVKIKEESIDFRNKIQELAQDKNIISIIESKNQNKASIKEIYQKHQGKNIRIFNAQLKAVHENTINNEIVLESSLINTINFLMPQTYSLFIEDNKVMVSLAAPVYSGPRLIGIITAAYLSKALTQALASMDLSQAFSGLAITQKDGINTIQKSENSNQLITKFYNKTQSIKFAPSDGFIGYSGYQTNEASSHIEQYFFAPMPELGIVFFISQHQKPLLTQWQLGSFGYFLAIILGLAFLTLIFLIIILVFNNISNSIFHASNIISIVILLSFTIISYYHYSSYHKSITTNRITEAKSILKKIKISNEQQINLIEFIGTSLSEDLSKFLPDSALLSKKISRILKDQPAISSVAISFKKPNHKVKNLAVARTENGYLEYNKFSPSDFSHWQKCAGLDKYWSSIHRINNKKIISFCSPFKSNKLINEQMGTVIISVEINQFLQDFNILGRSRLGYFFALDDENSVLYHPHSIFASDNVPFSDLIAESGSPILSELNEHGFNDSESLLWDEEGNNQFIYYNLLKKLNWKLIFLSFSGKSFNSDETQFAWFGINLLLILLLMTALIFYSNKFMISSSRNYQAIITTTLYTLLFAIILGLFWWRLSFLERFSEHQQMSLLDVPSTEAILEKLLSGESLNEYIRIPLGLEINAIDIKDNNLLNISGYIWQLIAPELDSYQNFDFPDALKENIELINVDTINDNTKYVFKFNATINMKDSINLYPFDLQNVSLRITPTKSSSPKTIFVPDFDSLPIQKPNSVFGISNFVKENIGISRTAFYFNASSIEADREANLGPDLEFNFEISRSLINAFMLFGFPLLMIMVALFTALFLSYNKIGRIDSTISSCMALLFTTLLLHRVFRSTFNTQNFTYMEIFFISAYLMIILAFVALAFIHRQKNSPEKISKQLQLILAFYWPALCSFWMLATYIHFYARKEALNKIFFIMF